MNIRKIEEEIYYTKANNPAAWFMTALGLKLAADGLPKMNDPEPDNGIDVLRYGGFTPIYRFLVGRSIENLLKGVIVAQGKLRIISHGKLNEDLKHHRLISLYKKAELDLGPEDELLLGILKRYCEWAGDYPIPKSFSDFRLEDLPSFIDYSKVQQLWNRIARYLFDIGWATSNDGLRRIPLWEHAGDALRRQLGELPSEY